VVSASPPQSQRRNYRRLLFLLVIGLVDCVLILAYWPSLADSLESRLFLQPSSSPSPSPAPVGPRSVLPEIPGIRQPETILANKAPLARASVEESLYRELDRLRKTRAGVLSEIAARSALRAPVQSATRARRGRQRAEVTRNLTSLTHSRSDFEGRNSGFPLVFRGKMDRPIERANPTA
jgi:hypothetical protein